MPKFRVQFPDAPGATLGLIGGLWGLIAALVLTALRIGTGVAFGDPLPWGLLGIQASGALLLVPFGLALVASCWGGPAQRSAAWASAAVVAAAAPYTLFSEVGFIFWPVTLMLLIAAVRAVWGQALRKAVAASGLALVLVALVVGAFLALNMHGQAMCWDLIRETNGFEHWESMPYEHPGTIDASGFGVIRINCTDDYYSLDEVLLSTGLLALAVGAWLILPRAPGMFGRRGIPSMEAL